MGHMRPGGATRRDAPGPAGAPAWAWRLALGLALGALLALAGPAQADLLIEGATTDPQGGAWTSPAGSTHGRTVLLLAGSGFSKGTDRPADRVTIGGAECAFVDYLSTEAQLACEAPPAVEAEPDAGGFGDKASEILVHPGGGGEPVAVQWKYQYREHLCPRLFGVQPQGASPGQSILYWGDFTQKLMEGTGAIASMDLGAGDPDGPMGANGRGPLQFRCRKVREEEFRDPGVHPGTAELEDELAGKWPGNRPAVRYRAP